MKIKPTIPLSLIAVSLAAYAGYLQMENSDLKSRLAAASDQTEVVEERATGMEADPSVESAELEAAAQEAGRETAVPSAPVQESAATEEAPEPSREERRRQMREAMRERMSRFFENPELRLDLVEHTLIRIDERYADFFKKLDLSPDEIDVVRTLMAEREVLGREARFRMMAAESGEDREAVREQLRADRELVGQEIETVLGEQQAAQMRTYTAGLPYKDTVEQFSRSLSYTETPLNERQSDQLLTAYARVNQQYEYTYDLESMNRWERRDINREQVETYFREREVFETEVLNAAAQTLSPEQLASLAEKQLAAREREQREMIFQIENPMGGGRGGWGPPRGDN